MRDRTQSRDFLLLGMGSSFNGFGMSGEQVIVGLLIFESTGTSAWVGVSLAIYFAPMFFFGAPAGALADTVDRRRMLAVLEVLEFAVLVVLGIAITFGFDTLAILLPLAFASGTIRAFHHPAKLGYAFDLSGPGRVVSTLGRLNVITRTGQLLGAVLAGTVAGQVSPQAGIFLIACGHLVGAMALGRMRTPGRSREARVESPWQTLVDYARELRENQSLRTLVVVICGMEVFGYSYMTLLPEIATSRLGIGAEGLGLLHALRGFGGLLSGLVLSRAVAQTRCGMKFLLAMTGFGLCLIALGWSANAWLVAGLVVGIAACAAAGDVLSQSLMQLCVPDRLRGRAMGVWVLAIGTGPIGHLQMGFLAGSFGVGVALGANGILLAGFAVGTMVMSHRLRAL